MSLKDFAIIAKLGEKLVTQARGLTRACTRCSGMLTGRSTRWRKSKWTTCRTKSKKMRSTRSGYWLQSPAPTSLAISTRLSRPTPSGRMVVTQHHYGIFRRRRPLPENCAAPKSPYAIRRRSHLEDSHQCGNRAAQSPWTQHPASRPQGILTF